MLNPMSAVVVAKDHSTVTRDGRLFADLQITGFVAPEHAQETIMAVLVANPCAEAIQIIADFCPSFSLN